MLGEPPPANSGRDRAIETLIDSESHGGFYRAARTLDDAVPYALSNRPNLVTRAALVEQANSLAEHEIDTQEKYQQVFGMEKSTTRKPDHSNDFQERVLRHHAKMVKVQRVHDTAATLAATPPPQLVAALRRTYTDRKEAALLRSLLREVTHHKAFSREAENEPEEEKTTTVEGSAVNVVSSGELNEDNNDGEEKSVNSDLPAANLESLIGNVCRLAVSESTIPGNKNDGEVLNGLLIAALSVLTASMLEDEEEVSSSTAKEDEPKTKIVDGQKMATAVNASQVDSLIKPMMPALQVGGVLSLLPSVEEDKNVFKLDPEILSYLGEAAAVYEERIEIQKLRVLAQLKAESERDSAAKEAAAMAEQEDNAQAEDGSDIPMAPVTPPSGNASGQKSGETAAARQSAAANVAIVEADEEEEGAVDAEEEAAHAPSDETAADREASGVVSEVSIDESLAEDPDEEALARLASLRQDDDSSDGDSTNSDDNKSGSSAEYDDIHEADNPQSAALLGSAPEGSVEIHEDNDDSSSSSSDDDDDVVDEDAMLVEDDDVESDDDEEDDVMLRQALALSLAEHSSALRNVTSGTAQEGAADGGQSGNDQDEENIEGNNEDEVGKMPPVEKAASTTSEGPTAEEKEANEATEDEKDDSLPAFPEAPSYYPYHSWLRRVDLDHADFRSEGGVAREGDDDSSFALYLEPSPLSKFGALPAAHVVVHLLLNALVAVQGRKGIKPTETRDGDKESVSDGCPQNSVPGGVGCSLFVPRPLSYHFEGARLSEKGDFSSDDSVSVQLLIAAFVLFSESRNHAIESLRQAILLELQNASDSDIEEELKQEEDSGRTPTSDEEDDPAVALAMNYASSPVHASSSVSESLEAKGMKRKAAAAAHDAALLMKSLRKRTESWKQRVQFYSQCTLVVMRCLRGYLQSATCEWLNARSPKEGDLGCSQSLVEFADFLPSTVQSTLADTLDSLMSVDRFRSFSTLFALDDAVEVEELLLPLKLYREAVQTWGECIPLIYPSAASRTTLLTSLINESYPDADDSFETVGGLKSLPTSEWQPQLHRLQLLCQRLCVSDVLDTFVSHPISYDPDDSVEAHEIVKLRGEGGRPMTEDPDRASTLVTLLGSASGRIKIGGGDELRGLYLALCHKCNVRTLLWDGFLACSGDDSDDRLASSAASPSLVSSDILGVASNPSTTLQFDASKCSDSIAILSSHRNSSTSSNGASAHQRASKVWGTVLSSSYFSPKTGVHRWAVRLDRCERGHVFVGVATVQASMRTYVGGDKFGWGVIGTQALWHDRRKIRGDYGATFRTGSTIVVTLDTDAGTLSFSSWKDSNSSTAAFSLDALLPSMSSPSPVRRHSTGGGGMVEDWGVAFEGLPLDSRLYPAVGLYQRDDRVTLLPVESGGRSALRDGVIDGLMTGGACYFPKNLKSVGGGIDGVSHHRRIVHVRRHNDLLSWDGVQYVTDILHQVLQSLQSPNGPDELLLNSVLPSIAASLCLVPTSIPVLSARCALALLPQLNRCIRMLDALLLSQNRQKDELFPGRLREGKWIIRATGSSGTLASSECEEYVVNLSVTANDEFDAGFDGTGVGTTGKSKNGLVSMMGTVRGSAMSFIEEWTDGTEFSSLSEESSSSCVIAARLSLDGSKFEGTYRNVQFGTSGHIAGMLCSKTPSASGREAKVPTAMSAATHDCFVTCEALLCLAHGHLAGILGGDSSQDHSQGIEASRPESYSVSNWTKKYSSLKACLLRPLLSEKLLHLDGMEILDSIREYYSFPVHGGASIARGDYRALDTVDAMLSSIPLGQQAVPVMPDPLAAVTMFDGALILRTGGKGSLCSLCPNEYTTSRRRIISALVCHCDLADKFIQLSKDRLAAKSLGDEVLALWRAALRIMEDGMRRALSAPEAQKRTRREVGIAFCRQTDQISSFLFKVQLGSSHLSISDVTDEFVAFYSIVNCEADIEFLEGEMERSTKRALLRTVSLQQVTSLLSRTENSSQKGIETDVAIECCMLALPRLLGRGLAEVGTTTGGSKDLDDWARLCNDDLGGYYMTNLSASGQISHSLRGTVHALFLSLGELLGNVVREAIQLDASDTSLSASSLVLAIIATFTATFRPVDVDEMILGSGILHHLQKIVSEHRAEICTKHYEGGDSDQVSVVRKIHETVGRDVSRAVLRASVSVAHVISFQSARHASMPSKRSQGPDTKVATALQLCVNLLLGEMAQTIPLVRSVMREELDGYRKTQVDDQWEKWCEYFLPAEEGRASSGKKKRAQKSGLTYLIENGTMPSSAALNATSQRVSSRPSSSVSTSGAVRSETLLNLLGTPCHQYVSQWLHILFGMVKFPASLSRISNSKGWMDVLLPSIGLNCFFDSEGHVSNVSLRQGKSVGNIPLRYRIRILRLLFFLLSTCEPNVKLVEGLFTLGGSSNSAIANNVDDDESFVSREIVSLLRRLYSLPRGSWQDCINGVMKDVLSSEDDHEKPSALRLGVLAFFSGSIGRISSGSYVLLKPAAAAPLSSELQSSSSSKSHSSTGGIGSSSGSGMTAHLVVGNGAEGVIAGLCRADASAGIVSSVDPKTGTCEVILSTRHSISDTNSSRVSQAPLRARSTESGESGASNARYTMTVRALRAPLSDVVNAEEVPLLLDAGLPMNDLLGSRLPTAIRSLDGALAVARIPSSDNEEKGREHDREEDSDSHTQEEARTKKLSGHDRSHVVDVCASLMTLRSAITTIADEPLLLDFLETTSARETLAGVLKLASCELDDSSSLPKAVECARTENLASLPIHEAKHCHLLSMWSELNFRKELLESTPIEYWDERLARRVPEKKENDPEDDGKDGAASPSGVKEGYSTPPSTSSATGAPPPLATSTAGDDGEVGSDARNSVSSSHRGISRSSGRSNGTEEDEDADSTAAAHLREAAIAQMAELGLPRLWSELALRRTGGTNIEAAVHFCLERGGDMERLLAEERDRERQRQSGSSGSRRRVNRSDSGSSNQLLRQLLEMGFPSRWCAEALAATRNNVDEALTWILTNGERLSAEDEGMEEDDDGGSESGEDEDSGDEEADFATAASNSGEGSVGAENEGQGDAFDHPNVESQAKASEEASLEGVSDHSSSSPIGWSGSVTPLRFISGRSIINPTTLEISGLPSGGFSSVGTKGVLLTSGKWYYEAILETAGCLQIGWADGSFSGHCHADRGDGCGDGPSSWAYDGWRRYRWHACATEWGCRWKEGDIVGCLVDMDNHVVSFTLNGRGEEIGMGVAFTEKGFRPCGGVYACVSFNRREKLRLILGGTGSEPFKHKPPPGYRGVGEAVLEAVDELDVVLQKEVILESEKPQTKIIDSNVEDSDAKRFLCDFSDGEHGHELFAWQHRYYGSDASVHLGSGRSSKQSNVGQKHSSGTGSQSESSASSCVSRRLEKLWSCIKNEIQETPEAESVEDASAVVTKVKKSYEEASKQISSELWSECLALGILYSRKFILHLMVSTGSCFDLSYFVSQRNQIEGETLNKEDEELKAARRLWSVLDVCVSLRSAGWVGEAGAMAVAAEALGLGISSNDNSQFRRHSSLELGTATESGEQVALSAGGVSQLLSTTLMSDGAKGGSKDASSSLAACAEAAIGGGGGGGPLIFLMQGLQSAARKSEALRRILIAVVRKSVRLLAVVDYAGTDSATSDNLEDEDVDGPFDRTSRPKEVAEEDDGKDESMLPDARLACFLTGLLLSDSVQERIPNRSLVMIPLFEAWSIGLLSASSPWRMVCALTSSALLNECPIALSQAVASIPTLAHFFSRLESTVVRRIWAERAAVPVCSRYVQSMVELLTSVKRAVQLVSPVSPLFKSLSVDAASPVPLEAPHYADTSQIPTSIPAGSLPASWEQEQGWVASDVGWEIWSGTIECMAVEWKTPSRSAVRTLMDGGEGPPMLREGCHVMRGLDWEESGSGSKTGKEDGKDVYEAEKAQRDKEKRSLKELEPQVDPAASGANDADATVDVSTPEQNESSDPVAEDRSHQSESPVPASPAAIDEEADVTESKPVQQSATGKKKKGKKSPSPKLPIGTVLSIEPWNGIPAMARRVRWHLTGIEGTYRYGGDGGRYDISHVEVNEKCTRVRKRHPLPESAEQCASRHGFGVSRKYSVLLRLRQHGSPRNVDGEVDYCHQGILEWPDYGAGIRVDCVLHSDGAVTITEKELLFGSKDSGWEARFGQPSYKPGTVMVLSPTQASKPANQADLDAKSAYMSFYEELLGSTCFTVETLRNRADGSKLYVTNEMKLLRARRALDAPDELRTQTMASVQAPLPPPICFDQDFKASSLSLSRDARTVTCVAAEGRSTAFAAVGFTKGVHYWEVKLEQADIGSVFIGVAEKPSGAIGSGGGGSSFGEIQPRLNRWHGWGFVNFRATYTAGAERVYGAHCHNSDTVGVLLDCDAGRVSFFCDNFRYGEHILNDLGCAFENVSPFGFNADGCGSGGAGQGAPSGVEGGRGGRYPAQGSVRPRALWPVIGLRTPGDRVTISSKWMSSYGVDGATTLKNILAVDEILCRYDQSRRKTATKNVASAAVQATPGMAARIETKKENTFPKWFVEEAFGEYSRWHDGRWYRSRTRGSGPHRLASFGLDVDLDTSPLACAAACAALGSRVALLSGDRVKVKRSAGRMLELAEEAVVLGAYQGRLYYRIVAQKSEGGSLTEGGGRAWFWDESEVVDNGLQLIGPGNGLGVDLPLLDRFKCTASGGLKVVYEGGAVVRSDLEIFDGSQTIGSIPFGTVIPQKDVLERRVNSCGVVRYRIRFEAVGEGWISSRIRGGKEESIVMPVRSDDASGDDPNGRHQTPLDCAIAWYEGYKKELKVQEGRGIVDSSSRTRFDHEDWRIKDVDEFEGLMSQGVIVGFSSVQSDELISAAVNAIADFSEGGDAVECSFNDIVGALSFAVASQHGERREESGTPGANQAAAAVFSSLSVRLPSMKALLARIAMLRAFNRRAKYALPWLPIRPSQEGSAILGGLCGHGASIERAGRIMNARSMDSWFQASCTASRVRLFRNLFFSSVKHLLLESITEATTTPTPLSHDEYELPREIRTVRINRLKAIRAMAGNDNVAKRKHSVFSQLQNETRSWGGAALRRGFVAKGHGGQKRAFKVKLIGEGVNDYSGPYREAFTDAALEVTAVDDAGHGALGVLEPTPNNLSDIGENRELFMFSPGERELKEARDAASTEELSIRDSFASLTLPRDESSREIEEALVFLGRMAGTACRHGIPVDLPLPLNSAWKAMVEDTADYSERVKELDLMAYRQLGDSKGRCMPPLLLWQQRMLNSFVEGLSNVLPVEIFPLFTGEELRDLICGNPDVDVDLLRRVVEYEGYEESDDIVKFFWEALREMSSRERKSFLQFVWARSRLPMKESDFDAPFKIQRDSLNVGIDADSALPSASTCFFSLTLPTYSSKAVLKEKLLFAIENVCTMESDYVTNDAEVSEGWRGL